MPPVTPSPTPTPTAQSMAYLKNPCEILEEAILGTQSTHGFRKLGPRAPQKERPGCWASRPAPEHWLPTAGHQLPGCPRTHCLRWPPGDWGSWNGLQLGPLSPHASPTWCHQLRAGSSVQQLPRWPQQCGLSTPSREGRPTHLDLEMQAHGVTLRY